MQRRDFLKAFTAAAAALAGGGSVAAASRITAKVSADTSSFVSGVEDARVMLERLLKECRVIGYHRTIRPGGFTSHEVTYRHDPDGKMAATLDAEVLPLLAGAKIQSAEVSITADMVDVSNLGDYRVSSLSEPVRELTVVWIGGL